MKKQFTYERGITLIELMVVVAVLAIVASLAVSSYRSYLLRANRTEATSWLMKTQIAQEKFFLQNNTYATNAQLTTAPPAGLGMPATTPSGFYSLSITNFTATTYTAVATAAGGQTADTPCQTFTISESGTRGNDLSCWR